MPLYVHTLTNCIRTPQVGVSCGSTTDYGGDGKVSDLFYGMLTTTNLASHSSMMVGGGRGRGGKLPQPSY